MRPAADGIALVASVIAVSALALVALAAPPAGAQSAGHPNILFVAIDDLNDWTGPLLGFGEALTDSDIRRLVTPSLDRLARLGVTFTNAQTAAPACNPSRAALLSGISPATSGLTTNEGGRFFRELPALRWATSLPQHLKRPDGLHDLYVIKTTGKIWHRPWQNDLPGAGPTPRAFTEWDEAPTNDSVPLPMGLEIDGVGVEPNPWPLGDLVWRKRIPLFHGRRVTDGPVLEAFSDTFSDQQKALWAAGEVRADEAGGPPKFIAVGIFRPHLPWDVPAQFFERFPLADLGVPEAPADELADIAGGRLGITFDHQKILEHSSDPAFPGETNVAWRLALQAYLASVAYADAAVGKMLLEVEAKNGDDDPDNDWTIVLWSDHGYHLGEKERWRKFTLWEESARSPLMIWKPGLTPAGALVSTPVTLLDLFPTLVELAGVDPLPQLQGTSFVDLLADPLARRDGWAVTTYDGANHTVRSRRWRYIRYADGVEELYDHTSDDGEHRNLLHRSWAARLAELGLDPDFVERVRRAHATALFEWSLAVHDRAIYDGSRFLEQLETLGRRTIERFTTAGDLAATGWTLHGDGMEAVSRHGVVEVHSPARGRATRDALTLGADEDFVASVAVRLEERAAGLGLVFGYLDEESFYELELVDESAPAADGTLDVRLLRREPGGEQTLLRVDDLYQLDDPTGSALDFSDGPYTLLARYTAADRSLELLVQNALGVNRLRHRLVLDEPLPVGGQFGISSWAVGEGGGRVDDFVALVYRPVDTRGPLVELDETEVRVGEGAGSVSVGVRRLGETAGAVRVEVATIEGTAWADQDFAPVSSALSWADGEDGVREVVVPVRPDSSLESEESFSVVLRSVSGAATLGDLTRTRVVIEDDDAAESSCAPRGETLCLLGDRFVVEGQWRAPDGRNGPCHGRLLTDETGTCWFFDPDNVEVVLKVLDACTTTFRDYWVFAAGLTDVETRLQVWDRTSGELRRYDHPPGTPFQPIQDTGAFATCP